MTKLAWASASMEVYLARVPHHAGATSSLHFQLWGDLQHCTWYANGLLG